jgi:hypothetical protein
VYITLSWTLTCGEDEESGGACGEGGIGAGWVSPVSEELLAARIVACRLRLPGLSRVFPSFGARFGNFLFTSSPKLNSNILPSTPSTPTAAPRIRARHSMLFRVGDDMVRSVVARCVKQTFRQSQGLHTRPSSHESSIAHLLDQGPEDCKRVVVNGFIRSIRIQKQRSFASVGDGSSLEPLQALLTPQQSERSELSTAPPHSKLRL